MAGRQSENIFERAIEGSVDHPESAHSLGVMKMIDDILRINDDVVAGVIDAFVHQIDHPDAPDAQTRLDAAVKTWEHACHASMTPDILDDLHQDAVALIEERKRWPPQLDEILDGWNASQRDLGYEIAGLLDGPRGTLHRLWAALSSDKALADAGIPVSASVVPNIHKQLERLIGRPLTAVEWQRLERHAHRHARDVMGPLMGSLLRDMND
ncbi:hypothetical protein SAMN02982994_4317 [Azospirillum lipoferum]|nr:hypothetical protein SAMN02982994_4317 [Azospirillum lipoferum]